MRKISNKEYLPPYFHLNFDLEFALFLPLALSHARVCSHFVSRLSVFLYAHFFTNLCMRFRLKYFLSLPLSLSRSPFPKRTL